MNLLVFDSKLPGSAVKTESIKEYDGEKFIENVFYFTDGIMLSQIKEISGVDGTTLQNWVKRGWIGSTTNKKYSKNQLARILIINMLRDVLHLQDIDFLLRYINGTINNEEDDIISEVKLYGYICRIIHSLSESEEIGMKELKELIQLSVKDYVEKLSGARKRLENALSIIITAYYSSLVREQSTYLLQEIKNN